jgi:hypothetical protein
MRYRLENVRFEGSTILGDHGTIHATTEGSDQEKPLKALLLSANPFDTAPLRLGEDVREIQAMLRRTDRLQLETRSAVRFDELTTVLIAEQPDVVHFSGHGEEDGGLIFGDAAGESRVVQPRDLADLFALLSGRTRCVVLSACHSAGQAEAIAEHIDFVVAMRHAIPDAVAVAFAKTFYLSLACGRDVPEAFRAGCVQVQIVSPPDANAPCLLEKP